MNFSKYVHGEVLTISDTSAKIDVRELANSLQSRKDIKVLSLIDVEIDSKGVKELVKLTHLTSLTLRNNKLGFEGAGYIGKSNLTNLTSLEISNNHIGDIGFAFLIGSKSLVNLTSLNVENNNIFGGEVLRYKGDIALKNLTSLYVEGNGKRFLDDKEVILKNAIRQNTECSGVEGSEGATQKLTARRKKVTQQISKINLSEEPSINSLMQNAQSVQQQTGSRLSEQHNMAVKQGKLRKIVLDTETTGLYPQSGHRIIEIGCVELINNIPTGKVFHRYINPERHIDKRAFEVHGISEEFLKDKPLFSEIAPEFLEFISSDILVIHNAPFDIKFLNMELGKLNAELLSSDRVLDTLPLARKKFPGSASLDKLCERFDISLNDRKSHGALIDAQLLAKVYVKLTGDLLNQNEEINEQLDEVNVSALGAGLRNDR